MPTFRPYQLDELRNAAESYGLDPAFVEAVYAAESSRGTNPKAMVPRAVKRKRDTTIVRGPFQLEDDTTADLIRKHKLGNVNVDDPDVHLDLALRLMRDLYDRYDGDYTKVAQAYLGGPGGVTNLNAKDELGTSTATYGNRILAEMARIQGARPSTPMVPMLGLDIADPVRDAPPMPNLSDLNIAEADEFGMTPDMMASSNMPERTSWHDLVAANKGLGIPRQIGGEPGLERAGDDDLNAYIAQLVDEEIRSKDFANAVS